MINRIFNTQSATTPVFDLGAEAERFYAENPDASATVVFVDAMTKNVVHPDPVKAQQLNEYIRDDSYCRAHIRDSIDFCHDHKTSEVRRSPFRTFVILYTGEDQIRLLGRKTDINIENFFNLDHELAHVRIPEATGIGYSSTSQIVTESVADINGLLRHFQRFGTETGIAERLMLTRIVKSMFYADKEPAGHFTAPAIEYLLSMKDKSPLKNLSQQETDRLSARIGVEHTPNAVEARILDEKVFKPIISTARHKTAHETAVLLADMTLETRNPTHFKWLSLAMHAFLDEKFSIKGMHLPQLLAESGRDPKELRHLIVMKKIEMQQQGMLSGITATTSLKLPRRNL